MNIAHYIIIRTFFIYTKTHLSFILFDNIDLILYTNLFQFYVI